MNGKTLRSGRCRSKPQKDLTIATLNIDWAKKHKNSKIEIEKFLSELNFDFLILTESIDLELSNYKFKYLSQQIPENQIYEGLNYSEYLKGKKAYRTIVYSQFPLSKKYEVADDKTSLALKFNTEFGEIVLYATIIGTWFNRQPYANTELENCIKDCRKIYTENSNLFIIGDLNTSFQPSEKKLTINSKITNSLENLFSELNLYNSTHKISKNIDHIVIPNLFKNHIIENRIFVEKDFLSDHQGVLIELVKI